MKSMKKIVALVVAMLLVSAMAYSAFAVTISVSQDSTFAGEEGADSREFTWYRVFTAFYGNDFTGNSQGDGGYDSDGKPVAPTTSGTAPVSYKASAKVAALLGTWSNDTNPKWTKAEGNDWFKLTPIAGSTDYTVEWDNAQKDAETVQAAAKWLLENKVYDASGSLSFSSGTKKWSATGLDKGYYILESVAGANLIAATTDIDVKEKNDYPPIDKTQADEDNTTQAHDDKNVAIGDVLTYEVKVDIPKTAKVGDKILVWDKQSKGLTYNNNVAVKTGSNTENAAIHDSDAKVTADSSWAWYKVIEITDVKQRGTSVIFTFTMTVNSDALTDTDKKNEAGLSYGNPSGTNPWPYESQPKEVEYKTYFGGIFKYDGATSGTPLEGVEFTLKEKGTEFKVSKNADGVYVPDASGSSTVVTNASGTIIIRGLDDDKKSYTLTETKTLDGFNMLDHDVTLTLHEDSWTKAVTDADGNVTVSSGSSFEKSKASGTSFWDQVENNKGTVLPSTGGMGTTIIYIVGALLVIGAGVLLVSKRRAN